MSSEVTSDVQQCKTLEGVVISKTAKSIKVKVALVRKHSKYGKIMKRSSYIWAHDESDSVEMGAKVAIKQSRPYSKLKRWEYVRSIANS